MKISKMMTAFALVAFIGGSAVAAVKGNVTIGGKTRTAYDLTTTSTGKLTVQYDRGDPKQTLKLGQYKVSGVKISSAESRKMDSAYKAGKYGVAVVESKKLFEKYKWLGAGVKPVQVWGESLYAQKKYNDAKAVFVKAKKFVSGDDLLSVILGEAKCLQQLGKNKDLAILFPKLVKRGGSAAAFVFNAQGAMAKEQKNNNDALLAYMKTFTLFSATDSSVKVYRAEAKKEIIAIFAAMGDNRAKTFVNEK